MAKAARRAGRRKLKTPRSTDKVVITVRAKVSELLEAGVTAKAPLERMAREWGYILRSRARWCSDSDLRQYFRERALEDLVKAGLTREFLQKLTAAYHIEVELLAWDPADDNANRIHEAAAEIPWEYLLSAATRREGRYERLLITRLFLNGSKDLKPTPPQNVLFVESAPGRLQDNYDFDSELGRIRAATGTEGTQSENDAAKPDRTMDVAKTPSVSELNEKIRSRNWDVLHITGVDTHQASWLIEGFYEELFEQSPAFRKIIERDGRIRDGMILRESDTHELPVPYEQLAMLLVNPKKVPSVVTLNLFHSGARTARELVRGGAHAAIGFLDEIDDELAELFFQAFYWEWCRPDCGEVIDAFLKAWQTMTEGDRLHGTSIVIWTGRSTVGHRRLLSEKKTAAETSTERMGRIQRHANMPIHELLQVEFDDEPEDINYSLLHNERPLLEKLTLTKLVKEELEDISVLVELNMGAQNYPYRCTQLVLDQPQLALAEAIKIPLTASLPRSLRERVQSTVYVKVTCGQRTAFETTKRVTLIPIDEWLDDTEKNPWLPSFVVPRDPAILKIIESSRRYLIGIRDDPNAGFEGYQAVDNEAVDPSAAVDMQVQAIWTAIVNDYRLQYINPPPSYSRRTQRLRTPSDIVESNSGTCIDLTLLLASCLEYIDIYSVVVLLTGHAFVGYWRSEEAHDRFVQMEEIPHDVPAVGSETAREAKVPYVDAYGWRLTRRSYEEILKFMEEGDLVMVEATDLTATCSFAEARDDGAANMKPSEEFDSMLDIRLARSASPPVTPLPILPWER